MFAYLQILRFYGLSYFPILTCWLHHLNVNEELLWFVLQCQLRCQKVKTKFILKRTRCAAAVPPYYAIHCSFPVSIFSQKKNSKYKLYCILLCRRWSDGRCSGASPSPCPSPVCVRTMCILNFFTKKFVYSIYEFLSHTVAKLLEQEHFLLRKNRIWFTYFQVQWMHLALLKNRLYT